MFIHWIRGLSVRLWVTTVAALAVMLAVVAALVIYAFNRYPEQTLGRHEQIHAIRSVRNGITFNTAGAPVSMDLPAREALKFQVAPTELKYRVLDAQGHVLLASAGSGKQRSMA